MRFYYQHSYFFQAANQNKGGRSKMEYVNSKLENLNSELQILMDIRHAYQDLLSQKETYLANLIREEAASLSFEKQQPNYRMSQGSLLDLSIENRRKI